MTMSDFNYLFWSNYLQLSHRKQDGQSMAEYMLLLAVIVVLVISAMDMYTDSLVELYNLILTTLGSSTSRFRF